LRLRQSSLAFPQRFFDMSPIADIVDHPNKIATALRFELADRQVQRESRPVLAAATNLSTDTDDLPDAGAEVVSDISIMLGGDRGKTCFERPVSFRWGSKEPLSNLVGSRQHEKRRTCRRPGV